jgi:hypothetical protein
MGPVAAAEADGRCSKARAIQDMPADRTRDQEVAGAVAAGTDWGVARHMETVGVARHRTVGMAVSMQALAPVESIQAWNLPQVDQHRGLEHAAVVMDCPDQEVQKHSSA